MYIHNAISIQRNEKKREWNSIPGVYVVSKIFIKCKRFICIRAIKAKSFKPAAATPTQSRRLTLPSNRKKSVCSVSFCPDPARLKISRKFPRKVRPRGGIPSGQLKSRNRTCSLIQAKQARQG